MDLIRFKRDGSRDESFVYGSDNPPQWIRGPELILLQDGTLVLSGEAKARESGRSSVFEVVRLTERGTLHPRQTQQRIVGLQSKQRLLVRRDTDPGGADTTLFRLKPDGSVDPEFRLADSSW